MWPPPSPLTHPAVPTYKLSAPVPWTPPPPRPRFSPPSSYIPEPITVSPQLRSTRQMSSHKAPNQKASRKFVKWLLFLSSSPAKSKPTKSKRPSPPKYYRYVPPYDCACWECYYSRVNPQEGPSRPSSFTSQFKVIHPQGTRSVVEPASPTKVATEWTESISTVEPIFELRDEQIYELE
jgi:hypothetical protein